LNKKKDSKLLFFSHSATHCIGPLVADGLQQQLQHNYIQLAF
jgi:hypothetical protein